MPLTRFPGYLFGNRKWDLESLETEYGLPHILFYAFTTNKCGPHWMMTIQISSHVRVCQNFSLILNIYSTKSHYNTDSLSESTPTIKLARHEATMSVNYGN